MHKSTPPYTACTRKNDQIIPEKSSYFEELYPLDSFYEGQIVYFILNFWKKQAYVCCGEYTNLSFRKQA